MNNDKFVDLITVNDRADEVTVHYFDEYTGKYSTTSQFAIQDGTIRSVVPTKSQTDLQGLMLVIHF